jgi:predicted transcriptional regulator
MASTVVNVRVDDETREGLERLAVAMDRPKAQLAARAIVEYVRRNSWQVAAIEEGLAQLDRGEGGSLEDAMAAIDRVIDAEEARQAGRAG